jgi:hypothetical protein
VLERLFADPGLPNDVRRLKRRAYATFYRTLAGGYYLRGSYGEFLSWGARAVALDPAQLVYMAKMPLRRWQRSRSRGTPTASLPRGAD